MNEIEKEIEETTEKEIRKDGDVTMCDLLDKEIEQLATDNNVACKEIEEIAKILKGYCCLIGGNPTKGDCYQCKQANASCYNYAEYIYNAGYRNVKDKVVLDKEEYAKLRNLEINYEDTYENYREYAIENNKLKEEIKQVSELKSETIKLAKQETAREILKFMFDGEIGGKYACKVMSVEKYNELAKQNGVKIKE